MKFFTLHIRLTRDCNAHCDYCSSAGMSAGRMALSDFEKSLDFIISHIFPRLGIGKEHFLTVEYLGGEVLLVPEEDLRRAVEIAREKFKPLVRGYRDGAQSNLIGSPRRILALHDLFSGRLGTSWDNHTGQRHINGSPELYRGILNRSLAALDKDRSHNPGRVLVVDSAIAPHAEQEVRDAIKGGYDLVMRPVFKGGSDDIHPLSADKISDIMVRCYRIWSEKPSVRIEPFYSLFMRRRQRGLSDATGSPSSSNSAGCPFQSDCAFRSLSLDPDGSLHICQEMADAGNYPLGNAIKENFNDRTWRLLARRTAHLSSECARCTWREECGGGCMNEAIEAHGDPFAKTELCPAWKAIFREIEHDIHSGRGANIEVETA